MGSRWDHNSGGDLSTLLNRHQPQVNKYHTDRDQLIITLLLSLQYLRFTNLSNEFNNTELCDKSNQQLQNAIVKIASYKINDPLVESVRLENRSSAEHKVLKELLGW